MLVSPVAKNLPATPSKNFSPITIVCRHLASRLAAQLHTQLSSCSAHLSLILALPRGASLSQVFSSQPMSLQTPSLIQQLFTCLLRCDSGISANETDSSTLVELTVLEEMR